MSGGNDYSPTQIEMHALPLGTSTQRALLRFFACRVPTAFQSRTRQSNQRTTAQTNDFPYLLPKQGFPAMFQYR